MINVIENLYVGSDEDVEIFLEQHPDGAIVHAAKDPWHRNALGYTGRGAPKDHPEYLFARRDARLYLNMVDAHDPKYIPKDMFTETTDFLLDYHHDQQRPCLVHCNQGKSRSPALVMWYMHSLNLLPSDYVEALDTLSDSGVVPEFGAGVEGFMMDNYGTE